MASTNSSEWVGNSSNGLASIPPSGTLQGAEAMALIAREQGNGMAIAALERRVYGASYAALALANIGEEARAMDNAIAADRIRSAEGWTGFEGWQEEASLALTNAECEAGFLATVDDTFLSAFNGL